MTLDFKRSRKHSGVVMFSIHPLENPNLGDPEVTVMPELTE